MDYRRTFLEANWHFFICAIRRDKTLCVQNVLWKLELSEGGGTGLFGQTGGQPVELRCAFPPHCCLVAAVVSGPRVCCC